MATTKKTTVLTEEEIEETESVYEKDVNAKVTVKLPLIKNDDSDVYVSVNDYTCLIKRGVEVEVPRFVAEALRDSEDAEIKAIERNNKVKK